MITPRYILWNDLTQSADSGEDDEGYPSYDAAQSACSQAGDMPAYHSRRGLVVGRAACSQAEAADLRAEAQDEADRVRRAAVVASIAAQPVAAPVVQDRSEVLRRMLANNIAALAACKRSDRAEIARLEANCAALRKDLGITT